MAKFIKDRYPFAVRNFTGGGIDDLGIINLDGRMFATDNADTAVLAYQFALEALEYDGPVANVYETLRAIGMREMRLRNGRLLFEIALTLNGRAVKPRRARIRGRKGG